jgi:hypothetical protein
MEGLWRVKDSSFVHARRSEWRSVADTVTSHKIRDTREGQLWTVNSTPITWMGNNSKISRQFIFPILSSTLACKQWGLIKLRTINLYRRIPWELRACKSQEIITPAENPPRVKMYKSCRREVCRIVSVSNTSKRAVVRLLYTGELFLQSHLIVCKWLRAASLHFRHVPEALATCLTAAMCDRIVPITFTGKSSIPFARLSSIFHIRFPILFRFLCCLSLPGTRSCNQKGGGVEHLSSGYNAPDRLP